MRKQKQEATRATTEPSANDWLAALDHALNACTAAGVRCVLIADHPKFRPELFGNTDVTHSLGLLHLITKCLEVRWDFEKRNLPIAPCPASQTDPPRTKKKAVTP